MTCVDFVTFCHPPHLEKLHASGVLREMVDSHEHDFHRIYIVHQRCRGLPYKMIMDVPHLVLETEDYYPEIFERYNIQWPDLVADEWTHGHNAPHFWENHVQNHLVGFEASRSPYIVFSDCDCLIWSQDPPSWIERGIEILEEDERVLIVSPGDGGGELRLTQNVSQQLFLCDRLRFSAGVNLGLPWNGEFDAPGGPMQEYYWMLEGRIGRYMTANGLYRAVLPDSWARYWHYSDWQPTGWVESR